MGTIVTLARRLACLAVVFYFSATTVAAPAPAGLFVRAVLQTPADRAWRVQIITQRPGGKSKTIFAGKTVADTEKAADFLPAGQPSQWVEVPDGATHGQATIRFLFATQPEVDHTGVVAKFDVATAPEDAAILRSVVDHDPGNIIAIRIPADPTTDKAGILSIREDTQRRLNEVIAMNLPDGPRPKKIWCMTGFRSSGEFYTDPAIAEMDMDIIRRLGMNGYWQQGGGQPGDLRRMAHADGIDRSTVYWRSVETLPGDKDLGGATRLDWKMLDQYIDKAYINSVAGTRKEHPADMPEIVADLMDEPAGMRFDGPEYQQGFRAYLQQQNLTPQFFGKNNWADVSPIILGWREFFTKRAQLDEKDESARKVFYWSAKFWNHATARVYAMATRKVEQYAPGVGTRVNFGPPWWYDYGTLPRGIDAFEFGRLRSVTLGFNEDWVGHGSPRVPLEINTLLMDWSRAAARPNTPTLGSYITRDADRGSVKLRTFACLAREAKIFDFYYYGPAYTFFDHWSDNASMVQGVAEVTRQIGAADDLLWAGRVPKAEVALLYSQSWPVWKTDDTEQCEQIMAYLALLHAGIPVDIVCDAEVSDGRFAARNYKVLYVVNESVPKSAAVQIERWVHDGGRLWSTGWAGMRDEYNTPTDTWNAMLGIKSRTWKPTGDLKRLGQPIEPADWKRPVFGREVQIERVNAADQSRVNLLPPLPVRRERVGVRAMPLVPTETPNPNTFSRLDAAHDVGSALNVRNSPVSWGSRPCLCFENTGETPVIRERFPSPLRTAFPISLSPLPVLRGRARVGDLLAILQSAPTPTLPRSTGRGSQTAYAMALVDGDATKPAVPDHQPPAYQQPYGKGTVLVVPWTAGKEYMDAATEKSGSLAHATLFPDDARRGIFADFALKSGVKPPATTSINQVLAWPLWTQGKGVVLLANYTGEPLPADVQIRFTAPFPVSRVHSIRHGDRPVTRPDAQHVEVTVPMDDVTDILVVE